MSVVQIACPECTWESEVDESFLGRRVKCPKCKESFVAEKTGCYDLVEPPPRPRVVEESTFEPASLDKPARGKAKGPTAKPAQSTPSPKKPAQTEPQPDPSLLANLEKWAEE